MAERVAEPIDWGWRRAAAHPNAYPWDEWCDGSPWRIYRFADYQAKTTSMISMLQRAARERGLKVRVRPNWDPLNPQHQDSVTFQFFRT